MIEVQCLDLLRFEWFGGWGGFFLQFVIFSWPDGTRSGMYREDSVKRQKDRAKERFGLAFLCVAECN